MIDTKKYIKSDKYPDYQTLNIKLKPDELKEYISLRKKESLKYYFWTLNKTFWIYEKALKWDLQLFKKLYKEVEDKRSGVKYTLTEAVCSAQIDYAVITYNRMLEKIKQDTIVFNNESELMVFNVYRILNTTKNLWKLSKYDLSLIAKELTRCLTDKEHLDYCGEYRTNDSALKNSQDKESYNRVKASKIDEVMKEYIGLFNIKVNDIETIVIRGCLLHYLALYISPFWDGNGRIARLLHRYYLIKSGLNKFEGLSISKGINSDVPEYHKCFAMANNRYGDITSFVKFLIKAMNVAMYNELTSGKGVSD